VYKTTTLRVKFEILTVVTTKINRLRHSAFFMYYRF